jgi:hypothetical protein
MPNLERERALPGSANARSSRSGHKSVIMPMNPASARPHQARLAAGRHRLNVGITPIIATPGYEGLHTNPDRRQCEFVIDAYHQLWRKDKSFRMSKHGLPDRSTPKTRLDRSPPKYRVRSLSGQPPGSNTKQVKASRNSFRCCRAMVTCWRCLSRSTPRCAREHPTSEATHRSVCTRWPSATGGRKTAHCSAT